MVDEDDDKSKGFDISKLATDSADDHSVAASFAKQVAELQTGGRAMQAALNGVGGISAVEQAAKALAPYSGIQEQINTIAGADHFAQIAAQQDVVNSLLPDIREHLSAMPSASDLIAQQSAVKDAISSISALPENWANIYGLSTATRLAEEMRERHAFYLQPASAFADIHKDVMADANETIRALALPQFGTLEALGIDRIADAFSHADVFKSLGMASALDDDMRSVTTRLNEHISGISGASMLTEVIRAATIPADAFGAIEGLLARSLEAQEALFEEHRASELNAKKEASFQRRMTTLAVIINILMFLLAVAMQVDGGLADDNAAVRANTCAVHEMSESFDAMAEQIERMQAVQEKASEARVSDLLCMSKLVHASLTKEHDDNDYIKRTTGRAAERRGKAGGFLRRQGPDERAEGPAHGADAGG